MDRLLQPRLRPIGNGRIISNHKKKENVKGLYPIDALSRKDEIDPEARIRLSYPRKQPQVGAEHDPFLHSDAAVVD